MPELTAGQNPTTPAQAGYSKERTFQSTLVISVRTRPRSGKQLTGSAAEIGIPDNAISNSSTASAEPGEPNTPEANNTTQDRKAYEWGQKQDAETERCPQEVSAD